MRNDRRILIGGLMLALAALSGCALVPHGSDGKFKERWVNASDASKALEVTMQDPGVLARVHMAVFSGRVKGTYVMKEGDRSAEGRVAQVKDVYRLTSADGKEQRFTVDPQTGSLKDETGGIWKVDKPTPTATLKEW